MSLQLPVQSVPITTKVVSLNPAYGEMYLIQHYVIKFVTKLTPVFYTNKTDHHDITEILLKVALNTLSLTSYVFKGNKWLSLYQSLDFECVWWKLFQKHVVCTEFDIYVFIKSFHTVTKCSSM